MQNHTQLGVYMQSAEGFKRYELAMKPKAQPQAGSTLVTDDEVRDVQKVMMRDWVTLTGKKGPGHFVAAKTTDPVCMSVETDWSKEGWAEALHAVQQRGKVRGDRPFHTALPADGFLDIPEEIVTALSVTAGLRWGAIDLGGASGDLHHFDMGRLQPSVMSAIRSAKTKYKKH